MRESAKPDVFCSVPSTGTLIYVYYGDIAQGGNILRGRGRRRRRVTDHVFCLTVKEEEDVTLAVSGMLAEFKLRMGRNPVLISGINRKKGYHHACEYSVVEKCQAENPSSILTQVARHLRNVNKTVGRLSDDGQLFQRVWMQTQLGGIARCRGIGMHLRLPIPFSILRNKTARHVPFTPKLRS